MRPTQPCEAGIDERDVSTIHTRLAWDVRFRVAVHLGTTGSAKAKAQLARLRGSNFSYSGSTFNGECRPVSWPAGGQAKSCAGKILGHGKPLIVRHTVKGRLQLLISPYAELVASPASCTDTDGQPVTAREQGIQDVFKTVGTGFSLTPQQISDFDGTKTYSQRVRRPKFFPANCLTADFTGTCRNGWVGDQHITVTRLHG
jgi:hypothetical protein